MGMVATGCDNFLEEDYSDVNKIWYTTTDGNIAGQILLFAEGAFGANFLSNNYYGSHGIIKFDGEVTKIPPVAFDYEGNLKTIILPNSVTSIGWGAFKGCCSLTSITIPDGVTKINSETFKECSSLESVSLGNGVTEIGSSAFWVCSSLKSVDIPNNVTRIGQEAFVSCKNLETVTLGSGVTKIELGAFAGCSSLKSVYCKATTPPLMGGSMWPFEGCASNCKFYVPIESVSAYKNDNYWSHYADNIVGYDF